MRLLGRLGSVWQVRDDSCQEFIHGQQPTAETRATGPRSGPDLRNVRFWNFSLRWRPQLADGYAASIAVDHRQLPGRQVGRRWRPINCRSWELGIDPRVSFDRRKKPAQGLRWLRALAAIGRLTLRQLFFESFGQRSASVDTHLDRQDCSVLEHQLDAHFAVDLRRHRSNSQCIKRRCGSPLRLLGLVQQRDGDGRGKFLSLIHI